jgi:hypothetical protein
MSAPFTIVGIDHVVIRARDIGPMLDFYQRVLGCTMERAIESIGLFQLRAGRNLIDLVASTASLAARAAPRRARKAATWIICASASIHGMPMPFIPILAVQASRRATVRLRTATAKPSST